MTGSVHIRCCTIYYSILCRYFWVRWPCQIWWDALWPAICFYFNIIL